MRNSLKKQMVVFVLLPVALLLMAAGIAGFFYARNTLIEQWRQGAILRLERAAHYLDMRLGQPIEWIEMFHETEGHADAQAARDFIVSRLEGLEGVTTVRVIMGQTPTDRERGRQKSASRKRGPLRSFDQGAISEITPPRFDAIQGQETVTLISEFRDSGSKEQGRLEVSVKFDHLMKDIASLGWWESQQVCLVDDSGRYLAHSRTMPAHRRQLGETGDPVELAVLEQMQEKAYGTILGKGHPPDLVSGFYRMQRAPWVLIMYAQGREILAPIIDFRFYYAIAGGVSIVLILLLIHYAGGRMVGRIQRVSRAFGYVARGHYNTRLSVSSTDEIGQLEAGFNDMIDGLKERDFIRDTFGRYVDREIAVELLNRPGAVRMGGEKREVAILMSDIRGFTAVAESLSPEQTIGILNHYFSRMIEVIHEHKGIIVDFYGDGVLVFFDPHDGPISPAAGRAVECSRAMQGSMAGLNRELEGRHLPQLETGIAVHAGQVVVGNIGSATRAKYGIVGLAVNLTQRMQAETRGGQIVVSHRIHELLGGGLDVKTSRTARFKGIHDRVELYFLREEAVP